MIRNRSFFPTLRAAVMASAAVAGLAGASLRAVAQAPAPSVIPPTTQTTSSPDGQTKTTTSTTVDTTGKQVQSVTTSHTFGRGKKKADADKQGKVLQSKDTKKAVKQEQKTESLAGVDAKLPDKQLYDKAVVAMNKGHYDVARLDLQTMLNTYPDSQYQMRAKLAIADSWYKEGGTAALTQAESEYADFRVFFPNAPEAAEAQMRIGDIYFRQMDKPDRDYAKTMHAEEEYRRMLTDYPNAPKQLSTQAKQRLREVQEVLGQREADIASYYAAKENWAAAIARYQTVADTYPLYSHMDDTLVGLGDAYEAQARYIRALKAPEAGKAKLEQLYDGLAADCYRKVVLEHSAAPHVEDAKDRLAAMSLPIPEPTKEQIADSAALENSRKNYTLANRAKVMFLHTPDTVLTAGMGDPTMADPKAMTAPTVVKRVNADFATAFAPPGSAPATAGSSVAASSTTGVAGEAPKATAPAVSAAPLAFQEVGTGDSPAGSSTLSAAPAGGSRPAGTGIGVEIVAPGTPDAAPVGGNGVTPPLSAPANAGLSAVGNKNSGGLPAIEKPVAAPDAINDVAGQTTPVAQAPPAKGKAAKPEFDKSDESSSKHKKKKGLKKLDPLPQ